MRIEKSQPYILKIQLNDDSDEPITTGIYYIKVKRNSDDKYWNGTTWVVSDGNYLLLLHDQAGVWEYELSSIATATEGQYTAFFNNANNPKINDSLDLEVLRTLSYWTVIGS